MNSTATAPPPPLMLPPSVVGAVLGGIWLNTILFAAVVVQVWVYIGNGFDDDVWRRGLVVVVCIIDIFGTIACNALAYSMFAFVSIPWARTMFLAANLAGTLCMQAYLILRHYRLAKSWILTSILSSLLLGTAVSGMWADVVGPTASDANTLLIVGILISGVADVSIAGANVFALLVVDSKAAFTSSRMHSWIKRLITLSLISGAVPALSAILGVISYFRHNSNMQLVVALCAGQTFCVTVLYTLNHGRRRPQTSSNGARATVGTPSQPGETEVTTRNPFHRSRRASNTRDLESVAPRPQAPALRKKSDTADQVVTGEPLAVLKMDGDQHTNALDVVVEKHDDL